MGLNIKLNKLNLNTDILKNIMFKKIDVISLDTTSDLKQTAPVDDTTKEKQKTIFKATGKRAWLMDNTISRELWRYDKSRRVKYGGKLSGSIINKSPASIALALGFTGLIKRGYQPVERTKNGKYSEQDPRGRYILESLRRAFQQNGIKNITIDK